MIVLGTNIHTRETTKPLKWHKCSLVSDNNPIWLWVCECWLACDITEGWLQFCFILVPYSTSSFAASNYFPTYALFYLFINLHVERKWITKLSGRTWWPILPAISCLWGTAEYQVRHTICSNQPLPFSPWKTQPLCPESKTFIFPHPHLFLSFSWHCLGSAHFANSVPMKFTFAGWLEGSGGSDPKTELPPALR